MSFRLESNSFVCRVNVHSLVRPSDAGDDVPQRHSTRGGVRASRVL
jgi:hypothetical protein